MVKEHGFGKTINMENEDLWIDFLGYIPYPCNRELPWLNTESAMEQCGYGKKC